jgi:hypothetical protein
MHLLPGRMRPQGRPEGDQPSAKHEGGVTGRERGGSHKPLRTIASL